MKRAFKLILIIPVAVIVVALSVANRHSVVFSIDPFGGDDPAFSYTIPLFWLLFGALAVGVIAGGVATWIGQSKWRRAARNDRAEIERTKRDKDRAQSSTSTLPIPADRQPAA